MSLVLTLAAIPQILRYTSGPSALLLSLTAVLGLWANCGFVLAWSTSAGMAGAFPEWKRQYPGLILALLLGLCSIPVGHFLGPVLREAAAAGQYSDSAFLEFPESPAALVALMLWSAGFSTIFLTAGLASLAARISGRLWIACLVVVLLRAWITWSKAGEIEGLVAILAFRSISSLISVVLFARFGLPSAMLYGAAVCLRHIPFEDEI